MLFNLFGGNFDIQAFIVSMLISVPGILLAISCHEWAHAFAAYKLGDPTAKNLGRMTIDPFRHMDLVGTLMLLFVGFGWAKPVPINPRNFKKIRRDDTIVSLAGVITNFILAFLLLGIYFLLIFTFKVENEIIISMVGAAISVNIGLGVFNLLPVPPLDGYHLLKNIFVRKVDPKFFWNLERYGSFVLLLFLVIPFLRGIISAVISFIFNLFMSFYSLFF